MPHVGKPDTKGDLYATIDIQLPRSLTKEQREAWEAVKKTRAELDRRDGRPSGRAERNDMNIQKYTEKAQEAIVGAQQLADREGHPEITPEHLLLTLIEQQGGIVPRSSGR